MPFSLFGQGPQSYDYTRYSGLSLEDLYQPTPQPVYPEPPDPLESARDLDEERRRQIRRNLILQLGGAFGAAAQNPGALGSHLARAAAASGDYRDQMLAEANESAARRYQKQRAQVDEEVRRGQLGQEEERRRTGAQTTLDMVSEIAGKAPELRERAEFAAREGRVEDLRKMLDSLPGRAAYVARGLSPDDPFADEEEKARIARESAVAQRREMVDLGIFWEPEESVEDVAAKAEAQAAAYARHRRPNDEDDLKPRWYEVSGVPGLAEVGEDGAPVFRPATGAPEPRSRWSIVPGDSSVTPPIPPYRVNVDTGETELIDPPFSVSIEGEGNARRRVVTPKPKKKAEAGVKGGERSVDQKLADVEHVVGGLTPEARAIARRMLAKGTKPRDVVRYIEEEKKRLGLKGGRGGR